LVLRKYKHKLLLQSIYVKNELPTKLIMRQVLFRSSATSTDDYRRRCSTAHWANFRVENCRVRRWLFLPGTKRHAIRGGRGFGRVGGDDDRSREVALATDCCRHLQSETALVKWKSTRVKRSWKSLIIKLQTSKNGILV
jgi:hypothetical protein